MERKNVMTIPKCKLNTKPTHCVSFTNISKSPEILVNKSNARKLTSMPLLVFPFISLGARYLIESKPIGPTINPMPPRIPNSFGKLM